MSIVNLVMAMLGLALGVVIIWGSQGYAESVGQGALGGIASVHVYRFFFLAVGVGMAAASLFLVALITGQTVASY